MKTTVKLIAMTGVLAMAACGSSSTATTGGGAGGGAGGGGAGGGGGGASAFDTNFAAAQMNAPTTTPITGSANYDGQVNIIATGSGTPVDIVGDLAVTIDFDAATNPISGSASNFEGTIDGTAVDFDGSLTTAEAIGNGSGVNSVTSQTVNAPVVGPITTTGILAAFEGTLTETTTNDVVDSQLTIQGNMTGADGAGSFGVAGGFVRQAGQADQLNGGTYYLNKQ